MTTKINEQFSLQVETFMRVYNEIPGTEWKKFHHNSTTGNIEILHGRIHSNGQRERAIAQIFITPKGNVIKHALL